MRTPFFRVLFGLFTLIGTMATVFFIFRITGLHLLPSAGQSMALAAAGVVAIAGAEILIGKKGLHRHGVEEGLVIAGVFLLVWAVEKLVPTSLWQIRFKLTVITFCGLSALAWLRYGYHYAAYAAALAAVHTVFIFDLPYVQERLWAVGLLLALCATVYFHEKRCGWPMLAVFLSGLFLLINLKAFPFAYAHRSALPGWFYWGTYGLSLLGPLAAVLVGLKFRKRPFLDAGLIGLLLFIIGNKPYWELKHKAWDPALLGLALMTASLLIARRLRGEFTSEKLTEIETHGLDAAGAAVLHPMGEGASAESSSWGGGDSGGGGASRGF